MKVAVDRNPARRGITLIVVGVTAVMVLVFSLSVYFSPARAGAVFAATLLCGSGSAPDYGFTYDLQQAHWTLDWQDYASLKRDVWTSRQYIVTDWPSAMFLL